MADKDVVIELVDIKTNIQRVLNHQIENKQKFEKFENKISEICKYLHGLDLKILEGDNASRDQIKESISRIYLNVAGFGAIIIVGLVGSIITYLAYKI